MAGTAAVSGPLSGGYLTTYYSWRWSLRINVAVAGLSLVPGFALFGIGIGTTSAQLTNSSLSSVPLHLAGEASAVMLRRKNPFGIFVSYQFK
ncbi:MAG TPA: hypothetical protein VGK02_06765 [Candidatus Aquicultor sp.]